MFPDAICHPLGYTHPWSESYDDRLRALVKGSRHIAYVYEGPDSSSFRYRVFNMIEALQASPERDVSASWFTRNDLRGDLHFVDRADAVVICRTRYDHDVARLIARAMARDIRVVFDIDDLVFDTDYVHMITQTLGMVPPTEAEWSWWSGYIARLGMTLKCCDAVIATTTPLAERVRTFAPNRPVAVVPNFLNRRQPEVSRLLLERKRGGGYRRVNPTTIGYFSGSATHNRDLLVASSALAHVLDSHADVAVRLVGAVDLNDVLKPYGDRIERVSMQDFVNLQRLIAQVEVNIVPLQNNAFTNCKSELKYFEAAVVGVVTIASPTIPLAGAIRDGENGYLAGAHEWEQKISGVIDTLHDEPVAYAKVADAAAADAEARFGWFGWARAIESAVFG